MALNEAENLFHSPGNTVRPNKLEPRSDYEFVEAQKSIITHPLYTQLIEAHFKCKMVGATDEECIEIESAMRKLLQLTPEGNQVPSPELDSFMESFILLLNSYQYEIEKSLQEAKDTCLNFEEKLRDLYSSCNSDNAEDGGDTNDCKNEDSTEIGIRQDSAADDESFDGERWQNSAAMGLSMSAPLDETELKEELKQRYWVFLSTLKQDSLKKKKKGKLPKQATESLLAWWENHIKWPYPSEAEKAELAELTQLDSKQINNWFINQRKRHWGTAK